MKCSFLMALVLVMTLSSCDFKPGPAKCPKKEKEKIAKPSI